MPVIQGVWSPPDSAQRLPAAMEVSDGHYSIQFESGKRAGRIDTLDASPRLANVERKLHLADGSIFATLDNESIDRYVCRPGMANSIIHTLEKYFVLALIAALISVVVVFAFLKWGVPWSSEKIAYSLPDKTNQFVGETALDFLDRNVFEETQIPQQQQGDIQARFNTLLQLEGIKLDHFDYRLHIRNWQIDELSIPNAFALASGDILITDKLVELATEAGELESVLLHEIGHVNARHNMIALVQAALLTTAVSLTIGDASGLLDAGVGMAGLAVSSAYSRKNELEADEFAYQYLVKMDINPILLAEMLDKMEGYMESAINALGEREPNQEKPEKESNEEVKDSQELVVKKPSSSEQGQVLTDKNDKRVSSETWLDYLSSHPNNQARQAQADRYVACFKNKQEDCN